MALPDPADSHAGQPAAAPVMIRKYANRRLYNMETSAYITLDNLADMVRQGRDFIVQDARSGEDLTRAVLTQIIVEAESKSDHAILPIPFLRQLIGFYGDSLQGLLPGYLEEAMAMFSRQRQQLRTAVRETVGHFMPPGFEEMSRQNIAMLEQAISLFSPFYGKTSDESARPDANAAPETSGDAHQIAQMQADINRLRAELAEARAAQTPPSSMQASPATTRPIRAASSRKTQAR